MGHHIYLYRNMVEAPPQPPSPLHTSLSLCLHNIISRSSRK